MIVPSLGIDIAKVKFNLCLIKAGGKLKHKVFPNTTVGFEQLSAWLTKQGVERLHACLEATGCYSESLATYLYEQDHLVSVINPAAIKAFAQSRLSRTKTDRVDAELIARFCATQQPGACKPPASEVRELQALVRRLEALQEMRTAESNRLAASITVEVVRASVKELIAHLDEQIARTEKLIRDHVNHHPGLKEQSRLLDSIPGIGETSVRRAPGRSAGHQAVQKRPSGRRLRGPCAEGATVWLECQRTGQTLKDR